MGIVTAVLALGCNRNKDDTQPADTDTDVVEDSGTPIDTEDTGKPVDTGTLPTTLPAALKAFEFIDSFKAQCHDYALGNAACDPISAAFDQYATQAKAAIDAASGRATTVGNSGSIDMFAPPSSDTGDSGLVQGEQIGRLEVNYRILATGHGNFPQVDVSTIVIPTAGVFKWNPDLGMGQSEFTFVGTILTKDMDDNTVKCQFIGTPLAVDPFATGADNLVDIIGYNSGANSTQQFDVNGAESIPFIYDSEGNMDACLGISAQYGLIQTGTGESKQHSGISSSDLWKSTL